MQHSKQLVDQSGGSEIPEGLAFHPQVVPVIGGSVLWLAVWRGAIWSMAALVSLAILGSGVYLTHTTSLAEMEATQREARLATDALAKQASQVINDADALIHGMRWVYRRTGSLDETERYVNELTFDPFVIGNLYFIGPQATIQIAHSPQAFNRDVSDREYVRFHMDHPADVSFISIVEAGRVTGDYYFRISRRVDQPDGSFGGVVLASLNPRAFAFYFSELKLGVEGAVALLSTYDRKLRARIPEPRPEQWAQPIDSPIWSALEQSPAGTYETASAVDGVRRLYTYRQVEGLPLVLTLGFTVADVERRVAARIGWLWPVAAVVILLVLILAALVDALVRTHDRLAIAHSDLHDLYVHVRHLALFDPLTGLPSRTLFMERLKSCLLNAERNGLSCALLYLDLDDFKPINDRDGHEAGDEVLKVASQRMSGALRESDTVCRWGGDEFLILLPQPGTVHELLRNCPSIVSRSLFNQYASA
jgi:GGDEF domain-containing protein